MKTNALIVAVAASVALSGFGCSGGGSGGQDAGADAAMHDGGDAAVGSAPGDGAATEDAYAGDAQGLDAGTVDAAILGQAACTFTKKSSGCMRCLAANCQTETTSVGAGCGDYVSCVCPSGQYDDTRVSSPECQRVAGVVSCIGARTKLNACAASTCLDACPEGADDASRISFSCVEAKDSGVHCAFTRDLAVNFVRDRGECVSRGGVVNASCSTGVFTGTCQFADGRSIGFYDDDPTAVAKEEKDCTTGHGTWTAAPPAAPAPAAEAPAPAASP